MENKPHFKKKKRKKGKNKKNKKTCLVRTTKNYLLPSK